MEGHEDPGGGRPPDLGEGGPKKDIRRLVEPVHRRPPLKVHLGP
jgi:hypothetical protein